MNEGRGADAPAPGARFGTPAPRLGLLGGTFDPFHIGHLALARAAIVGLRLDQVRFVPSGQPWQKPGLMTPAADRLAMVRLGIAGESDMQVDQRELLRDGPTYTIDTLESLRDELGPDTALILLLGSDQFRNLSSWHRWRELLDYCHIAATQRETVPLTGLNEPVERWLARHGTDALPDTPAGSVVFFRMPPVPVSATAIRAQLARTARDGPLADGRPADTWPSALIPPAVLDYIAQHHLYRNL